MKRKIIIINILLASVCAIVLTSCSFMEGLVQVADALSTTTSSSYAGNTSSGYDENTYNYTTNLGGTSGSSSRSSKVPQSHTCTFCGGTGHCTGKHHCYSSGKCDYCGGKGTNYVTGIPYKCPTCNGKGKCKYCNGSGICKHCNGTGKS